MTVAPETESATPGPRLAYLVSEYPSMTSSFIRREVAALRRRGLDVRCLSVRTPPHAPRSDVDRAERAATFYVLPRGMGSIVAAQLWALARSPRRHATTFVASLRHRAPGLRALLWACFYFAEAMVVARELAAQRSTHLHNHFSNAGANVGYLAARYLGLPWSLTLHGRADFDGEHVALLRAKIHAAAFVGCISRHGKDQALRHADGADRDKLFVYRCGIDLAEIATVEPSNNGGPASVRRLVCAGRLSAEKAHHGLLEALTHLVERGHDVRLRLVGDGPERDNLRRRITELDIADRVELTGALPIRDVLAEMAQAEVVVLSSLIEGVPVVLMEAMALGVCVVAPRLAGIPELVDDRQSGRLFTPGDWHDLADQLDVVLSDAGQRERLGAAGRARVEAAWVVDEAIEPLVERLRGAGGATP